MNVDRTLSNRIAPWNVLAENRVQTFHVFERWYATINSLIIFECCCVLAGFPRSHITYSYYIRHINYILFCKFLSWSDHEHGFCIVSTFLYRKFACGIAILKHRRIWTILWKADFCLKGYLSPTSTVSHLESPSLAVASNYHAQPKIS